MLLVTHGLMTIFHSEEKMISYSIIEKTENIELVNVRTSDKDQDVALIKDQVAIIPVMQQDNPKNNFVVIKEGKNALLDIPILSSHSKTKDKEDPYEVAEDLMKSLQINGNTELIGKLVINTDLVPTITYVFIVHLEGNDLSSINTLGKTLSNLETCCQNSKILIESPLAYAVKHLSKDLEL